MGYKEYTVRVFKHGTKQWFLKGKLHREDGPACEFSSGAKEWYLNGKRHREDGPAIEWANGDRWWYLNDQIFSEKEFNNRDKDQCDNKVVEIDGKKYKLVLQKEG